MNTAIAILRGLRDGLYPALIARQLGKKRNLIHYYVRKLEDLGFIEKQKSVVDGHVKTRGAIALYHLTENGSRFLAETERGILYRKLRLHNCYWLYPIIGQPKIEIDWEKVVLQNGGQLIGRELGLTVRKNRQALR